MPEYLVGVKANGGFPNKDYLRIEVVEAESSGAAIQAVVRPVLWVTEFRRSIPAGMLPRTVDYTPRATNESVEV